VMAAPTVGERRRGDALMPALPVVPVLRAPAELRPRSAPGDGALRWSRRALCRILHAASRTPLAAPACGPAALQRCTSAPAP